MKTTSATNKVDLATMLQNVCFVLLNLRELVLQVENHKYKLVNSFSFK